MDRETSLGGGAMPPPPLPFHRKEAALNSQREREKETSWAYLWGKLSRGRGGRCIPVRPRLPPQLGPLTRVPALSRLQASHAHAGESYAPPNAGLLPLFTPALQPLPSAFPLPGVGRTEQRLGPRGMMNMLKAFPGRNRMQAAARLNVNLWNGPTDQDLRSTKIVLRLAAESFLSPFIGGGFGEEGDRRWTCDVLDVNCKP